MTRSFDMEHVVTFEDTNLVGNVYFANHLRWQGACRERFLLERCPSVLADLRDTFALVTTRCSCAFYAELEAFDRVIVSMTLGTIRQNRVVMRFDYLRDGDLVARGEQEVACMVRSAAGLEPVEVPKAMRAALSEYEVRA